MNDSKFDESEFEYEYLIEELNKALLNLGEHFDCIQILGTYMGDDGNTYRVTRGVGNWYARQGIAREFLQMDAAQTTAYELAKVIQIPDPSDGDGDEWKGES